MTSLNRKVSLDSCTPADEESEAQAEAKTQAKTLLILELLAW